MHVRMTLGLLLLLAVAASAWAQPGGERGGPGGGFFPGGGYGGRGGPGGPGGGPGGGFDIRGMLQRMDQNGNGVLEQDELSGRAAGMVRGMAERAGLNPNEPLRIDRLAAATQGGFDRGRDGGRDRGRGRDDDDDDDDRRRERESSSGSGSSPAPYGVQGSGVQGFGVAADENAPKAPGFDVPLTATLGPPLEERYSERVLDNARDMLRDRDANKNSVLERTEWTGRWSPPADEADLNRDGILTLEELAQRSAKRYGQQSSRDRGRDGDQNRDSRSSSGSGPSGGPFGGFSGGQNDAERFRRFGESLIRQYDKSGNGMLEREEWKDMRPEHQAADTNPKDGVITVEELSAGLQSFSAGGGFSRRGSFGSFGGFGDRGGGDRGGFGDRGFGDRGDESRDGDGGSSRNSSSEPVAKKSYRTTPPTELLPKGVPDFFLRNDADADGQISMAEYATSWNDQIAAEFQRLDLNGDGILTAAECLQQGRR